MTDGILKNLKSCVDSECITVFNFILDYLEIHIRKRVKVLLHNETLEDVTTG
jgi:hypothetical protein